MKLSTVEEKISKYFSHVIFQKVLEIQRYYQQHRLHCCCPAYTNSNYGKIQKITKQFINSIRTFLLAKPFCCSSSVGKTHRMKESYYKFFLVKYLVNIQKSHHATGWRQTILEFFLNVITLYKPRTPSVLYIFIRASNIPLYCRLEGSTPALYCSTSRVLVTHIGFVMQRVMAPENRQKLHSLLCQLHRLSQFDQFNVTQASTMTKLLFLPEHSDCLKQVTFMHSIALFLSLQSS